MNSESIAERSLPAQTAKELIPPKADFPYLAVADEEHFRFEPDATAYSRSNARLLAEASMLAYGEPDFVRQKFDDSDFKRVLSLKLEHLGAETGEGTQGFFVHDEENEKVVIVAFAGTHVEQSPVIFHKFRLPTINGRDLLTDGQFPTEKFPKGGSVHSGFLDALSTVWTKSLQDRLHAIQDRSNAKIWFTGHSLGAGLATLAAASFGADNVQGLYTFGSPRVGDAEFAHNLHPMSTFRVVNNLDFVTAIPPEIPIALGAARYVHVGTPKVIDRAGAVGDEHSFVDNAVRDIRSGIKTAANAIQHFAEGLKTLFNSSGEVDLPVPVPPITDHAPINYVVHLWNDCVRTRQNGF